jgi:hypothetical protein
MIVDGSSALKAEQDPKHAEMVSYLSESDGYWLLNDTWYSNAKAYVSSGISPVRSFLYSKDDRIVRHNSGAGTRR